MVKMSTFLKLYILSVVGLQCKCIHESLIYIWIIHVSFFLLLLLPRPSCSCTKFRIFDFFIENFGKIMVRFELVYFGSGQQHSPHLWSRWLLRTGSHGTESTEILLPAQVLYLPRQIIVLLTNRGCQLECYLTRVFSKAVPILLILTCQLVETRVSITHFKFPKSRPPRNT